MTPSQEALASGIGLVAFMLVCAVAFFVGIKLERRSRRKAIARRRGLDIEAAHATTSRAVAGRPGRGIPGPANGNGEVVDITALDSSVLRRFHSAGTGEVVHYGKRDEEVAPRVDEHFVVGEEGDMGIEMFDLEEPDAGKDGVMLAPRTYAESVDDEKTDLEKAGDVETGAGLPIKGGRC